MSINMLVMFRRARLYLPPLRNVLHRSNNILRISLSSFQKFDNTIILILGKPSKFVCASISNKAEVISLDFEKACVETLESLTDYFEELVENAEHLKSADVSYSDGVLTVNFGQPYGSYVINRQSPNRQIWLSSPTTGPKRYDFVPSGSGCWIYKHDGVTLHELLQNEIEPIVKKKVTFSNLIYGNKIK